jgi:hypothetical protein
MNASHACLAVLLASSGLAACGPAPQAVANTAGREQTGAAPQLPSGALSSGTHAPHTLAVADIDEESIELRRARGTVFGAGLRPGRGASGISP